MRMISQNCMNSLSFSRKADALKMGTIHFSLRSKKQDEQYSRNLKQTQSRNRNAKKKSLKGSWISQSVCL